MILKKVTSLFTSYFKSTLTQKISSKVIDKNNYKLWYSVKNDILVGKDGIKNSRYWL